MVRRRQWPVEAARAMKIWKTQKQVSHIFTARWETGACKKRGRQFPTAPTSLTTDSLFDFLSERNFPYTVGLEMKVLIVVEENNS